MTNADEMDCRPKNVGAPRREPSLVGLNALTTTEYRNAFGVNAGYEPTHGEILAMGDLLAESVE